MKQLKRKLSFLLIAVMVLTMNVQFVHATETTDPPMTEEGNGDTTDDQGTDETTKLPTPVTLEQAQKRTHQIIITGKDSGHTYEAYQIFKGRADKDGEGTILADIDWGKGVTITENFWEELKACTASVIENDTEITVSPFENCEESAAAVANVLANYALNENVAVAFSRVVGNYLNEDSVFTSTPDNEDAKKYVIEVIGDGYYFIKDKDGSLGDLPDDAYTKYMLQVVGKVEVTAKADKPTIDKKIVETELTCGQEENENHTHNESCYTEVLTPNNNTSIGDEVKFKVTSKVPDMDGYTHYYFVVNDTMSQGLEFIKDSVEITISGAGIQPSPHRLDKVEEGDSKTEFAYTVSSSAIAASKTAIEIVFKDFIQYKEYVGADIEITYKALVTRDALIGVEGNSNKVTLTYSNDPQKPGHGDRPDPNDPTGKTPEEETITYVTGIELIKVDGDGNRLVGAKFSLTGEAIKTVLIKKEVFTESATATLGDDDVYYKLNSGVYTASIPAVGAYADQIGINPNVANPASYAGITLKEDGTVEDYSALKFYTLEQITEEKTETEMVNYEAEVGTDGILRFDGLAAGKYTITELVAPDGYNILDKPIEIEIGWSVPTEGENAGKCVWTVTGGHSIVDGVITMNIENNKGTTLPSTGGMGTTIFYAVGSILVLGAAIILIAKKRTSAEK